MQVLINGEEVFRKFVINKCNWMDPNTQVLAAGGDIEGLRIASNQIHYKSLKGRNDKEYDNNFGAKSYVDALLGAERNRLIRESIEHKEGE